MILLHHLSESLLRAHAYSQLVAAGSQLRELLSARIVWTNIVDQLALALPASVAVGVFALAAGDVYSERVA